MSICIQQHISFGDWLAKRGINLAEFRILKPKDREKMFLCWKWGSSDHRFNMDSQTTRNQIVGKLDDSDVESMKGEEKEYYALTLAWERKCRALASSFSVGNIIHVKYKEVVKWHEEGKENEQ
jgi:hypothetical protein